jgi:hypothetical protein
VPLLVKEPPKIERDGRVLLANQNLHLELPQLPLKATCKLC